MEDTDAYLGDNIDKDPYTRVCHLETLESSLPVFKQSMEEQKPVDLFVTPLKPVTNLFYEYGVLCDQNSENTVELNGAKLRPGVADAYGMSIAVQHILKEDGTNQSSFAHKFTPKLGFAGFHNYTRPDALKGVLTGFTGFVSCFIQSKTKGGNRGLNERTVYCWDASASKWIRVKYTYDYFRYGLYQEKHSWSRDSKKTKVNPPQIGPQIEGAFTEESLEHIKWADINPKIPYNIYG